MSVLWPGQAAHFCPQQQWCVIKFLPHFVRGSLPEPGFVCPLPHTWSSCGEQLFQLCQHLVPGSQVCSVGSAGRQEGSFRVRERAVCWKLLLKEHGSVHLDWSHRYVSGLQSKAWGPGWVTRCQLTKPFYRLTKWHNGWGWEQCLETLESSPPAQSRVRQGRLCRTLSKWVLNSFKDGKNSQTVWATCSSVQSSQRKKAFWDV